MLSCAAFSALFLLIIIYCYGPGGGKTMTCTVIRPSSPSLRCTQLQLLVLFIFVPHPHTHAYNTVNQFLIHQSNDHIHSSSSAQKYTPLPIPTTTPFVKPSPSPEAWSIGKIFSISTASPVRNILRREPQFLEGQYVVQQYVEQVESDLMSSLNAKKVTENDREMSPCNSDGRGFKRGMSFYLELRNLPPPDLSCITQFIGTTKSFTGKELFKALQSRAKAIYENRYKIADVVVGNWSEPDAPYDYKYVTDSHACIINAATAIRVVDKWFFLTEITNANVNMNLPLFERFTITEHLSMTVNDTVDPSLVMPIAIRPPMNTDLPPDTPHMLEDRTTTILTASRGSVQPPTFVRMYIDQIPAVLDALDQLDTAIQQANDALTPSSIAILVLPLALNLVPCAIIYGTAISSLPFFMYTMMTDVISVVPLVIKGVELIQIGRLRQFGSAIRITSAVNGTLSPSAAAQMWAVQCTAKRDLERIGVAFVSLSASFIVIGIALEFIARAYVNRQMRRNRRVYPHFQIWPSLQRKDKLKYKRISSYGHHFDEDFENSKSRNAESPHSIAVVHSSEDADIGFGPSTLSRDISAIASEGHVLELMRRAARDAFITLPSPKRERKKAEKRERER